MRATWVATIQTPLNHIAQHVGQAELISAPRTVRIHRQHILQPRRSTSCLDSVLPVVRVFTPPKLRLCAPSTRIFPLRLDRQTNLVTRWQSSSLLLALTEPITECRRVIPTDAAHRMVVLDLKAEVWILPTRTLHGNPLRAWISRHACVTLLSVSLVGRCGNKLFPLADCDLRSSHPESLFDSRATRLIAFIVHELVSPVCHRPRLFLLRAAEHELTGRDAHQFHRAAAAEVERADLAHLRVGRQRRHARLRRCQNAGFLRCGGWRGRSRGRWRAVHGHSHHNPEPEAAIRGGRRMAAAAGSATAGGRVVERPAPQHPRSGIAVIRAPLIDIAQHVGQPKAVPASRTETVHRCYKLKSVRYSFDIQPAAAVFRQIAPPELGLCARSTRIFPLRLRR